MPEPFRIYIDDSGNVDAATTNLENCRYGSITAVILKSQYLDEVFNKSFSELSIKHFGTQPDGRPWVLHRRLLTVPPEKGPFSVLRDAEKQAAWNTAALRMFEQAKYSVISACVDKVAWYYNFPEWSGDFYEVLVTAVLERAFYFLKNRNGVAEVNIETKSNRNDRIKAVYRRAVSETGFKDITAEKLQAVFSSREINILTKADARPGCQLADLLASPALNHIRQLNTGRHQIASPFVRSVCNILESEKFYREPWGGPEGYGRIWRPRS